MHYRTEASARSAAGPLEGGHHCPNVKALRFLDERTVRRIKAAEANGTFDLAGGCVGDEEIPARHASFETTMPRVIFGTVTCNRMASSSRPGPPTRACV